MRKILKKVIFLTAILLILQSGTVGVIAAQAQPAVPVLKGTVKGDTVTLQWNKAKGSSGCQIFLYYKLYTYENVIIVLDIAIVGGLDINRAIYA